MTSPAIEFAEVEASGQLNKRKLHAILQRVTYNPVAAHAQSDEAMPETSFEPMQVPALGLVDEHYEYLRMLTVVLLVISWDGREMIDAPHHHGSNSGLYAEAA